MGDDIGWYNVSAYNRGIMGYRTPNIDRLAKEGAIFTDWYGQQPVPPDARPSSLGQSPIRTGLTNRVAGCRHRHWPETVDGRRGQVVGIYDRTVRQKTISATGRTPPDDHGFDEFSATCIT